MNFSNSDRQTIQNISHGYLAFMFATCLLASFFIGWPVMIVWVIVVIVVRYFLKAIPSH